MDVINLEKIDLRTRNKLATREALGRAAFRLALEQGPENVRVEKIAAEAGVSPRTYNNYFSSREEAICAIATEKARQIGQMLWSMPASEPLDEAVIRVMLEEYAGGAEPDRVGMRMLTSNPLLRGEFLKSIEAVEVPLAEAIAVRTGTDADKDLFPRVAAAAVAQATRVAIEQWLDDGDALFTDVLREALTMLAPALRSPLSE
jgi:AcrR family transcriptional regulator